jgi:hypothetical protein
LYGNKLSGHAAPVFLSFATPETLKVKRGSARTEAKMTALATPRFEKPKIMLIDCPSGTADPLVAAGYNVTVGTFGDIFFSPNLKKQFASPVWTSSLPGIAEQEIIVVNTAAAEPQNTNIPAPPRPATVWHEEQEYFLDPRPYVAFEIAHKVTRILKNGGVLILFSDAVREITYGLGKDGERPSPMTLTNWSFWKSLESMDVYSDQGEEIVLTDEWKRSTLGAILQRHMAGFHFTCIVTPKYKTDWWVPILVNKYARPIGGFVLKDGDDEANGGWSLLLPQHVNPGELLLDLVSDYISNDVPKLFAQSSGLAWVNDDQYASDELLARKKAFAAHEIESSEQAAYLEQAIRDARQQSEHLAALLTATGHELVQAVIQTLSELGFRKVIDVDAEAKATGHDAQLREDLQLHDLEPPLVVDVKGINGNPSDAEIGQADKHARMRSREWRKDVGALFLVNQWRGLPPIMRDANVFRQPMIDNAKDIGQGLMTTWTLFTLYREAKKWGWQAKHIIPIFWRAGVIDHVPEHYELLCKINGKKLWSRAVGIVGATPIKVGDRLSIETDTGFTEFNVRALQVDRKSVSELRPDEPGAVEYEGAAATFGAGARVFRLKY